jgi:adenosine deaminase CECR1
LISQDRVFRENLSGVAEEACAIVDQIRFEEAQSLWTREYEDSLTSDSKHDGDIYPGMMFSLAKERIEKSKLWTIVRRMPKGALLHCHFEAMIEVEWIVERAFELGNVGIKCRKSLWTAEARLNTPFEFGVLEGEVDNAKSIWSSDYTPNTLVHLNTAADSFPRAGRAGFLAWVKSRCSITPQESVSHHHGVNQIWVKFISTFGIVRTIIYIEAIFPQYVRRLCQQLHNDNVLWADVRALFSGPGYHVDDQYFVKLLGIFGAVVEEYRASPEGAGFWGMRIIWTTARIFDKRDIIDGTFSTKKYTLSSVLM